MELLGDKYKIYEYISPFTIVAQNEEIKMLARIAMQFEHVILIFLAYNCLFCKQYTLSCCTNYRILFCTDSIVCTCLPCMRKIGHEGHRYLEKRRHERKLTKDGHFRFSQKTARWGEWKRCYKAFQPRIRLVIAPSRLITIVTVILSVLDARVQNTTASPSRGRHDNKHR